MARSCRRRSATATISRCTWRLTAAPRASRPPLQCLESAPRPSARAGRSASRYAKRRRLGRLVASAALLLARISCIVARETARSGHRSPPSGASKAGRQMLSTPPSAAASASLVRRSRLTCRSRRVLLRRPPRACSWIRCAATGTPKARSHLRPQRLDGAELGHFHAEVFADAQDRVASCQRRMSASRPRSPSSRR